MMKRKSIICFIKTFLLLVLSLQALVTDFSLVSAATTIFVPGDYSTIQEAIDNASEGDTIIVNSSTYKETITIDIGITLQGEDRETTLIDGMKGGDTVTIWENGVTIKGFTICNSSDDALDIYGVNNTKIVDCTIKDCGDEGAYVSNTYQTLIYNCTFRNMGDNGIRISTSQSFNISLCEFYNNSQGIYGVTGSGLIQYCELHDSRLDGIELRQVHKTQIEHSIFQNSEDYGMYISRGDFNTINNCTFNNNSAEGLYLLNSDWNQIVDCRSYNNSYDGISVRDCDRLRVSDCEIYSNNDDALSFDSSDYFTVTNCNLYDNNDVGFYASASDFGIIQNSVFTSNMYGINIFESDTASIHNCTAYNNTQDGLRSANSQNTHVSRSRFSDSLNGCNFILALFSVTNSNFTNCNSGLFADWSNGTAKYCSLAGNIIYGAESNKYLVEAIENWWGNETGPTHTSNPTGTGDTVSPNIRFDPWQTALHQPDSLISDLRYQLTERQWAVIYPDDDTPKPLECASAMVSDWLASNYFTTKVLSYVEGQDTSSAHLNQTTGEVLTSSETCVLTFGGPVVNPIVKRAEDPGTPEVDRAPIRYHSESSNSLFQYSNGTNIPGAVLPNSVINNDQDMFVIERYIDGSGRLLTLCYGFGWQGTYAAGKYFEKTVYLDLGTFNSGWVIVKWEDTNGNGFVDLPGEGDTYTIIATGN